MTDLEIHATRGELVESVHRVSAAVVGADGTLIAQSGDPDLITFWRSAAKPFQALPLVEDGVLERFELGVDELALACASHSSETVHLAVVDRFLTRIGCSEDDLACGPHIPLGRAAALEVATRGIQLTPRWNNCSGKHAGMLALARHHGWPTAGYHRAGHPVQERILAVVTRWTGLSENEIRFGTDGCTALNFGLPLRKMALAYARLGATGDAAPAVIRNAMMERSELVAGEGRFCTELMRSMPGQVIAKVGAGGIYCAALVPEGVGIALKVEDGDMHVAPIALLEILRDLFQESPPRDRRLPSSLLETWAQLPVRNTREEQVGAIRAAGALRRSDAAR